MATTVQAGSHAGQSKKAAASGWIGSALEYYDFFIYATAASLIFPQLFFPSSDPTVAIVASLATYGVGYVARPIGAFVLGHYGDTHGRKGVLLVCMFLMGFSTMAVGLLPTYAQVGVWAPVLLVVLRLIQGFAVAGEISGASSMILEHAPFGRRGYDEVEVDDFLRKVTDALSQSRGAPAVDADEVHQIAFRKPRIGSRGYDEDEVDAFLDLIEVELRWRASPEGQAELSGPVSAPVGYGPPGLAAGLAGPPVPAPAAVAPAVRAVTVALLADRGRMLVAELPDPVTGRTVYRPVGGDIGFGERGHEAVRRAVRDDYGIQLSEVRPLATLESIHRFAGREAHELVLVYEVTTADPQVWAQPRLLNRRGGPSAIWAPVDMFRRNEATLLPEGLLPLLG
jgi:DivIVA domain-containing protein